MKEREKQNNDLIDWRRLPWAVLSLAIGGVICYSMVSNFGLGYVVIAELPQTAGELAEAKANRATQSLKDVVAAATREPESPPVTPPSSATAPPAPKPESAVPADTAEGATAVVSELQGAASDQEPLSQPDAAGIPVDADESESENLTAIVIKPVAPENPENPVPSVVVSPAAPLVTEDTETGIVKIELPEGAESTAVPESGIAVPDTAEIVAAANRAAGVTVPEDEPEPVIAEIEEPEEDQELARYSTDPEDLPILQVIVPDAETQPVEQETPAVQEVDELSDEPTLSRAITDAVDSGVVSRVVKLIKKGEPVDGRDRSGQTMLLKAAWNGDEEMFYMLLENGASIEVSSNDGRTPLFSATVSGNIRLVRELVNRGALINTQTNEGKSPLMVSAWSNYPEIARFLLERGAQPDLTDRNGRNALFYALWDRNIDVVRTLIQYGAGMEQVDNEGHSAVDIARLRRIQLPGMSFEAFTKESEGENEIN